MSLVTRAWATAWEDGVTRVTTRQRDRMVMIMSSSAGAHSSQTVRGGGSSMAFSRALAACSGRPVGVVEQDHPPAAHRRPPGGPEDELAGLLDAVREALRTHRLQVGVGSHHHLVARVAVATPLVGAEQRGGEGLGGVEAAGTGRAGEEPRVGHARAPAPGEHVGGSGGGLAQDRRGLFLADEVIEHVHPERLVPDRGHRSGVGLGLLRHRVGQHLADPILDQPGHLRLGERAVDDEVALGVTGGQRAELLADPLVEVERLRLDPVGRMGVPPQAHRRRDVDEHGQMGHQPAGGPLR